MPARLTQETFEIRANSANPDLDLSLAVYVNSHTHVDVICKICGHKWPILPYAIFQGVGCPICRGGVLIDLEEFIRRARLVHDNVYDYSRAVYINSETPIWIRCKKCGRWFQQIPKSHLQGKGCKYCNTSHGEKDIELYLKDHCFYFEREKKFKDCKDKFPLPFDFYIPSLNTCIEFQGIQHYEPQRHFGGDKKFERQIKHDKIKLNYCLKNHIRIIRIKYTESVKEILELYIKNKGS